GLERIGGEDGAEEGGVVVGGGDDGGILQACVDREGIGAAGARRRGRGGGGAGGDGAWAATAGNRRVAHRGEGRVDCLAGFVGYGHLGQREHRLLADERIGIVEQLAPEEGRQGLRSTGEDS